MDRFSKVDMLEELRIIFLFEADHILLGRGHDAAEAFIGFGPDEEAGEYLHMDPGLVDLSRFRIASQFERGYDVAFRPSIEHPTDLVDVQDMLVFMEGTPRAGGIFSGGEMHRFMSPDGYCRQTADAVKARWMLEAPTEAGHHEFSARDLALLANMSEGAVRNAMAEKGEGRLRAIPGSKPVRVAHDDAVRWLSGRRGFIPRPKHPSEDRFLAEKLRDADTTLVIGSIVGRLLGEAFGTYERASRELEIAESELDSWRAGTYGPDAATAMRIAKALSLDVPVFVGKAMELCVRRIESEGGPK